MSAIDKFYSGMKQNIMQAPGPCSTLIVQQLLDTYQGCYSDECLKTYLLHTAETYQVRLFMLIFHYVRDRSSCIDATYEHGDTILHRTCRTQLTSNARKTKMVQQLLSIGFKTNQSNDYLETPLTLALTSADPCTVRTLVQAGASIDTRDKYNRSSLHIACSGTNPCKVLDIVLEQIEETFPLSMFTSTSDFGQTPFEILCGRNEERFDIYDDYESDVDLHHSPYSARCPHLQQTQPSQPYGVPHNIHQTYRRKYISKFATNLIARKSIASLHSILHEVRFPLLGDPSPVLSLGQIPLEDFCFLIERVLQELPSTLQHRNHEVLTPIEYARRRKLPACVLQLLKKRKRDILRNPYKRLRSASRTTMNS